MILARLQKYRDFIIAWLVDRAMTLFFGSEELTPDEEAALRAELEARASEE